MFDAHRSGAPASPAEPKLQTAFSEHHPECLPDLHSGNLRLGRETLKILVFPTDGTRWGVVRRACDIA